MLFIKQNDRRPAATAVIKHGTSVVPLTNAASATYRLTLMGRIDPTVEAAGVITDAANGAVEYRWGVGDTATPGTYRAEWIIIWNDGTPETFPTIDYDIVVIRPNLDGS